MLHGCAKGQELGAVRLQKPKQCEGCSLKRPSYGLPADRKMRWCGDCKEEHPGAVSRVQFRNAAAPAAKEPSAKRQRVAATPKVCHQQRIGSGQSGDGAKDLPSGRQQRQTAGANPPAVRAVHGRKRKRSAAEPATASSRPARRSTKAVNYAVDGSTDEGEEEEEAEYDGGEDTG